MQCYVNRTERNRRKIKFAKILTYKRGYNSVAIQTYLEMMSIEEFVQVEINKFLERK